MDIQIRKEEPADFPAVYKLNHEAFKSEGEAKLVEALRKSSAFIPDLSLVAELNGIPVGHILFTKLEILGPDEKIFKSLALAPMAIAPDYQNHGIGSELIKEGLKIASAIGHESIIVLGHESYYPKFGFTPASRFNIKPPFDVPDSAFMALELNQESLKGVNGIVRYPKEFNEV